MKLRAVDKFLLENADQIERVDKYVNYLTMVAPGQKPELELTGELCASLTAMLYVYKNQVAANITENSQKSLQSRFLDAQYRSNKHYHTLAYILGVINSTELLVEMSASHYRGKRGKWNAIVGVESLKCIIRLVMLLISKRAMPCTVPLHDDNVDQEELLRLLRRQDENRTNTTFAEFDATIVSPYVPPQERLRPIDLDRVKPPIQLIRELSPQLAISEVVAILRPLIYALLLKKYRHHPKSWTPWLVGFALEFMSQELAKGTMSNGPRMSGLEKEIYGSRGSDMLWWLMRGAAFEHYTKDFITAAADKLARIPLLGMAGNLLKDGMGYFDDFYFATATL